MTRPALLLFLCATLAPVAARAAPPAAPVRLRRFALLIGVNDGGGGRAQLRYATSDARSMARVLESLGGVSPGDLVFVDTPTRAAALDGFTRVDALMRAGQTPGVRRELLVYYSGHSDEDGLLLGADRVTYDELRARIKALPADLRVAILDSCASGAFTRGKGGVRRPPFLVDASADMRGHAFLTSSAANEVAQESDRIAASFFTYFLVSGLRGAADVNQDHRVTLQEAYQFASQETLARTERTRGGPQHAAYEFELTGTGDMVVTDVRTTQASLVLAADLTGRISVREAGGGLVAELHKTAGNTIELGVEAGSYVIAMEAGGGAIFEADATLASGEHANLSKMSFHPGKPLEVAVARGNVAEPADGVAAAAPPARAPVGTKLGIIPRDGDESTDVDGFSFGFVGDRAAHVSGLQLALAWTQADAGLHGLQLTVGAASVAGDAHGLQLSSGLDWSDGSLHGAQLAGLVAAARGDTHGLQMAGIATLADGSFTGLQMAGTVAAARRMRGLQLAGAVAAAEDVRGLQLAPVNVAHDERGMQLGVVNVADDAGGFRLGVVNYARHTRGFQLGLVNVAEQDDGESLALVNIIGNGIHAVALYATDAMLTNVAVKLGGRHLYASLGAGYQPGDTVPAGTMTLARGGARWAPAWGVGWRVAVPAGRLEALEIEANSSQVFRAWGVNDDAPMLDALRVTALVRLAPHLSLLLGAAANVAIGQEGHDLDLSLGGPESVTHDGRTTVRIYPGFIAGLEI